MRTKLTPLSHSKYFIDLDDIAAYRKEVGGELKRNISNPAYMTNESYGSLRKT